MQSYMDLKNNVVPQNPATVHFIGICGTGMGTLACMIKDMGICVTGSDQNVYPPISDLLINKGIVINKGYDFANLSYRPDLVVIGNVISADNPEAKAVKDLDLKFCSMPQAVNRFAASGKKQIVVAGTHGKTTITSILSWILYTAGLDPSFLIGGVPINFENGGRSGEGDYIVIEGDEYDTSFFDKGSKFLHYTPILTVLTCIEFDHADIFDNIDSIVKTFEKFVSKVSGVIIAKSPDLNIDKVIRQYKNVERYGKYKDCLWRPENISVKGDWTSFDIWMQNKQFGAFKTKLKGEHNIFNITASVAAANSLGISYNAVKEAIETFKGVKRRQQIAGKVRNITVIDDFAHHPTEVRETIKALKPAYLKNRLFAVFEPSTNSSMKTVFQDIYPNSFENADIVCIIKPSKISKIPLEQRFSPEKLVDDLIKKGKDAYLFEDADSLIDFVCKKAVSGDGILTMSNRDLYNINKRLLEQLTIS